MPLYNVYRQMKAIPARQPWHKRLGPAKLGALVAAVAALIVLGVVLMNRGDEAQSSVTTGVRTEPFKADEAALRTIAGSVGHPVYWAPAEKPVTYEITQTPDGRLYIRYLPADTQLGDPRPNFLTVGTYPQSDAFKTVQTGAKKAGAVSKELPGGGLTVSQKDRPTSVFFAYPESTVLVEVYDPTAGRAEALVTSGSIRPIG